jgi:hypothetical protein
MRIAAPVAAVLLAGVACGGTSTTAAGARNHNASSAQAPQSGATGKSAVSGGASANASAGGSSATTSAAAQAAHTSGATQYPQYVQGTIPARVTVSLGFSCVRPGAVQTITIRTTPGYYVAFDTQYADGKDGQKEGGMGYTVMPANGTWAQTWTVSPSTAAGKATVFISVEGGHPVETAFRQPTFQVGSC